MQNLNDTPAFDGASTGSPTSVPPAAPILDALRRWWWLPLATAFVAGAVALALTSRQSPQYAATATAIVAPTAELEEASELLRGLDTLERRTVVATFARLAATRDMRAEVAAQLGLSDRDVRGHQISASVISSTNLIRIRAEGPDAALTAVLANTAARLTEVEARRLYRVFTLHTIEEATTPTRPIHPDPQRNAGVGGVLGLFLGVLAVSGVGGLRSDVG